MAILISLLLILVSFRLIFSIKLYW